MTNKVRRSTRVSERRPRRLWVCMLGRPWLRFLLDLVVWSAAVPLGYLLRLEGMPERYVASVLLYVALGTPVRAACILLFRLHRQSWSRVGLRDLWHLGMAVGLGTVALFLIAGELPPLLLVPRSVPVIAGGVALFALGGLRLGARVLREGASRREAGPASRVLIAGAGEAGTLLAREMLRHPEAGMTPVGFLDDDPDKARFRFLGLRVYGGLADLPQVAERTRADELLIAVPSAPGSVVRELVELARGADLAYRIVPGMYEILTGKVSISQIRDVALEDLLRRDPVELDLEEIARYLEDKVVLVTGAGGSIGGEIVRQVARFGPREIVLVGRGENSLWEIDWELRREWPDLRYSLSVVDAADREALRHVFRGHSPQVVFHAAAHKHVPLMELNPAAAVLNNVGGTQAVVDLCLEHGVERMVNISTDKVINPTSVMGATKRVAEYIVQRAARKIGEDRAFVSVRFGNVLGSRGSVVPLFQEQIRRGGPVTVTDPEMRRYFMTVPEAAQLVLQAGGLGENGAVYVLDMGEPVRVVDLAEDLIRLSGLEPGEDIEIEVTGPRPGEKLFEELLTAEEGTSATRHEKIFVARGTYPPEGSFAEGLAELLAAARAGDSAAIRASLKALVPTYGDSPPFPPVNS